MRGFNNTGFTIFFAQSHFIIIGVFWGFFVVFLINI
jgi:hypothetical protein